MTEYQSRQGNIKTQQSPVILDSCLRKKNPAGNRDAIFVEKLRIQDENEKPSGFKFLRFKGRFRKPPISWRIRVDGWPNHSKKAPAYGVGAA